MVPERRFSPNRSLTGLNGAVHACHVIHSLGRGGAEQVLVDLGRVSAEVGLRLSVVALVDSSDEQNARDLEQHGVEVHRLSLSSRWDPRAFGRAMQVVRRLQPDVLHTHLKHADLVGGAVARRLGLPLVSTLHLIEDSVRGVDAGKRWLAGQMRRRVADRTVAVSEAQRRWYLDAFPADPARVVTVHNGVVAGVPLDAGGRAAMRASLGVPTDGLLAVNVAIMRPGKGQEDLLAALARVPEHLRLCVALVGDGSERARLESLSAQDRRVSGRVRFAGYRDDVPAVLQAADVVVHPSHADALPTALIHALAASAPIVATDVGGIPEVVGEDAGVLLAPGDVDGLAVALSRLADDQASRARMGAAGRRRFEEHFEARQWARRLLALYDEVLTAGPGVVRSGS
jgi:glycosyltransferase involved in cell wall biosynthesis